MSNEAYLEAHKKLKEFQEYNEPKAFEFLNNISFDELTNAIKKKFGLDEININYTIKNINADEALTLFPYCIEYKSEDLVESSNSLKTMYNKCILESLEPIYVQVRLQDGTHFDRIYAYEQCDATFDPKQHVSFEICFSLHANVIHKGGGSSDKAFGYVMYSENKGWIISLYIA